MKSTAVIYHYYEPVINYKDNLIFFLETALIPDVDYYIIIADCCTVDLPAKSNIFYITSKNKNNDYGGYSDYVNGHLKDYQFFIFINSSVRGPFLPNYYNKKWTTPFIERLRNDVHLVGSSINIKSISNPLESHYNEESKLNIHVQTTAYALSKEALHYLKFIKFYDNKNSWSKEDVITNYECRMTHEIIKRGWKISCILPLYDRFYNDICSQIPNNFSSKNGDLLHKNRFYSRTLTPYDFVFIKTNRDVICSNDLDSYTYTELQSIKLSLNLKDLSPQAESLMRNLGENLKRIYIHRRNFKRVLRLLGLVKLADYFSKFY